MVSHINYMTTLTFSLATAVAGLACAIWCSLWVLRQDEGGTELHPPYLAIREGANAFIRTQYLTILAVGILLLIMLWITPQFGFLTALGFAIGGLCSAISGIAVKVHQPTWRRLPVIPSATPARTPRAPPSTQCARC